jgi:transcription elongation factor GreA
MAAGRPPRQAVAMLITDSTARHTDDAVVLLTHAEHARYRHELEQLRRVRDRELPRLLRDLRTYVASDAQEEIAQIEEQDRVAQSRIANLQDLLDGSRIVPDGTVADGVVTVGRTVEVLYLRTGRTTMFLVEGSGGGGPGTVSARSPVGRALLGRSAGDVIAVELPGGRIERLHVLAVGPGPELALAG